MPDRLVLPLPPTQNHSHRNFVMPPTAPGRPARLMTAPSRETKTYKRDVGWAATAWRSRVGWKTPPKAAKIVLRYWVFWPDRRQRDPSNLPKVLLDALTGVLWHDDHTVLPRAMDYAVDRKSPRIEVTLEEITTNEDATLFGEVRA